MNFDNISTLTNLPPLLFRVKLNFNEREVPIDIISNNDPNCGIIPDDKYEREISLPIEFFNFGTTIAKKLFLNSS